MVVAGRTGGRLRGRADTRAAGDHRPHLVVCGLRVGRSGRPALQPPGARPVHHSRRPRLVRGVQLRPADPGTAGAPVAVVQHPGRCLGDHDRAGRGIGSKSVRALRRRPGDRRPAVPGPGRPDARLPADRPHKRGVSRGRAGGGGGMGAAADPDTAATRGARRGSVGRSVYRPRDRRRRTRAGLGGTAVRRGRRRVRVARPRGRRRANLGVRAGDADGDAGRCGPVHGDHAERRHSRRQARTGGADAIRQTECAGGERRQDWSTSSATWSAAVSSATGSTATGFLELVSGGTLLLGGAAAVFAVYRAAAAAGERRPAAAGPRSAPSSCMLRSGAPA